jgi:ATP-dependent DNA helicase DinG
MKAIALDFPPPTAFGMPEQFVSWRPHQILAWQKILDAQTRFVGITAPTGSGKSLIYMTAIQVDGTRGVTVTGSKGLQAQLGTDFAELGVVDIRGQGNYPCKAYQHGGEWFALQPEADNDHSCGNGPCHMGLPCTLREAGCTYYDTVREALHSQMPVTNYAYWLTQRRYSQGLGEADILVLDEAHVAVDELSNALQIRLEKWLCQAIHLTPPDGEHGILDWQKWATWHATRLKSKLDEKVEGISKGELKYRKRLQTVERILRTMGSMSSGDWVEDHAPDAWVFECLQPAKYAEQLLFQGAKKIVFTSATLTEKTLNLLGVDPTDVTWFECPSHFPVERRPVIWVPTVKVDYRMTPAHWAQWVTRIDQILDARPWVKGIIHTVSYARAKHLLTHSAHKGRLVLPNPGQTEYAVTSFKESKEPFVLVSPAIMTGWDFPGEACRFQILAKLPFPDSRSKIVQARTEMDKDYGAYLMMQQLVQAVGRGMRSESDWCETIIIDDHAGWAMSKFKKLAPKWFWDSYRKSVTLPPPLHFAA